MTISEAKLGVRVRSILPFSGVPTGSEGVIDQDYGTGVMVAWDKPNEHAAALPAGYCQYDGQPAWQTGILRDGFNKRDELQFLEVVEGTQ